jgi:hypothetical protein
MISLESNANAVLTRCSTTSTSATSHSFAANGGMMYVQRASIVLTDCAITDATAAGDSDAKGGLMDLYDAVATLTRVAITKKRFWR